MFKGLKIKTSRGIVFERSFRRPKKIGIVGGKLSLPEAIFSTEKQARFCRWSKSDAGSREHYSSRGLTQLFLLQLLQLLKIKPRNAIIFN